MSNPLNRSDKADTPAATPDQAAFADASFADRLRRALGGREFAWLSRESGVSTSALSDLNTKGKIPRADNALKIARALGVSLDWLLTGQSDVTYAKADDVRKVLGERSVPQSSGRAVHTAEAGAELDLVTVREIDMAYGMGGTYSDVGVESQVLHFPRSWMETITRTPAEMLVFARGKGDSMQPTVQDGDIVLIDRSIRTIREQDAIWALTIGDIAMIKRVRIKGERVAILSDNDRVSPDEVHHEEINVVGRVVFIGRRI